MKGRSSGLSWSYDAAGNTLNDGINTYTYDANNQVTQLNGGAAVYKYDGQGSRVMKITTSQTIYYIPGIGEYYPTLTAWRKRYVYLGSEKLIEYSQGTTLRIPGHVVQSFQSKMSTDSGGSCPVIPG